KPAILRSSSSRDHRISLVLHFRPLKGMRVARASSEPKIPRRKRGRIYEMGYLGGMFSGQYRATGDPGVVTEPGRDDVDALGRSRHRVIERGLDDDGQHFVLQLFHQPAADDDHLRVED